MNLQTLIEFPRVPFLVRARKRAPGAPPGQISEPPGATPTRVDLYRWKGETLQAWVGAEAEQIEEAVQSGDEVWLDVVGLGSVERMQALGSQLDLHPLWLEDFFNVHQRPKHDRDGDARFVVLRMAHPEGLPLEQISMVLRGRVLLTVQERPGDVFEGVRDRLRKGGGRMRSVGASWLFYALIDALVDGYYAPLERLGEALDALEEAALARPHPSQLVHIRSLKRALLHYRRALWPTREALSSMERAEGDDLHAETVVHLRDCHDHVLQLLDLVETYREITSGLLDIYLSSLSHRMNEVMKVLTIIATIFIPLTFIAGIYGMNFDPEASPWNMPELGWRYGYPASLLFMLAIASGFVLWFRHRGWVGGAALEIAPKSDDDSD